jgi:hypothetical protein
LRRVAANVLMGPANDIMMTRREDGFLQYQRIFTSTPNDFRDLRVVANNREMLLDFNSHLNHDYCKSTHVCTYL